jgi:ubiquinone biosynthesis protein Coq4
MNWLNRLQSIPFLQYLWRRSLYLQHQQPVQELQAMPPMQPFLALMAGDSSLEIVGDLSDTLLATPSFQQAVTVLQQDPAAAALIAERYMAPPHDLDALLRYPPDSLGHIYALHMKASGFRAEDLYLDIPIQSEASYLEARLSQTHDIWHLITGFSTNVVDEIRLQAFHLPQFPYPLAVALISSTLMSTLLFSPDELPTLLDAIQQGWNMGKTAKPLFAQKWEEHWDKPLATWRAELGITPLSNIPAASPVL